MKFTSMSHQMSVTMVFIDSSLICGALWVAGTYSYHSIIYCTVLCIMCTFHSAQHSHPTATYVGVIFTSSVYRAFSRNLGSGANAENKHRNNLRCILSSLFPSCLQFVPDMLFWRTRLFLEKNQFLCPKLAPTHASIQWVPASGLPVRADCIRFLRCMFPYAKRSVSNKYLD